MRGRISLGPDISTISCTYPNPSQGVIFGCSYATLCNLWFLSSQVFGLHARKFTMRIAVTGKQGQVVSSLIEAGPKLDGESGRRFGKGTRLDIIVAKDSIMMACVTLIPLMRTCWSRVAQ